MGTGLDDDDRRAITRLVHRYCTLIDDGDFEGFANLFAAGTWVVEGDPSGGDRGRDAVLDRIDQNVIRYDGGRPNTRHLTSNLGSSTATATPVRRRATCSVMVLQAVPPDFPLQPIFAGFYTDRFERADGNWHFTERRIRPDLVGDLSRHRSDAITELAPGRPRVRRGGGEPGGGLGEHVGVAVAPHRRRASAGRSASGRRSRTTSSV